MKNIVNKIKKLFAYQQIRFLFVGGLNTLVGYGTYVVLLLLNVNYLVANTISTIIGIIHSYIWNRKFTFNSKKNVKQELLKFVSVYFVSYVLGLITIFIFVSLCKINTYVSGAINLVITTLISWFGHKYFSFKKEVKK